MKNKHLTIKLLLLITTSYLLLPPPVSSQTPIPLGPLESVGPLGMTFETFLLTQRTFNTFISLVIGFLTVAASLWFLVNFILGAYQWLSAGGNQDQLSRARDKITHAIIGLALVVAAYSIVGLVAQSLLGIPVFDPLSILPR